MKRIFLVLSLLTIIYSCDDGVIFETDISGRSVTLLAPVDGVEVAANSVFFDWQEVADATSYEIQVATPDFANAEQFLANERLDSVTSYNVQLVNGNYQWRVRAINSGYETGYTTASFKVIPVEDFSSNTVVLNSPDNNLSTNSLAQTLSWQVVSGATLYRIQILSGSDIMDEFSSSTNSADYTFEEGSFTWQVRAENGVDNTLYFGRSILTDITIPNTPNLTDPVNMAKLSDPDVSFGWTRETIAGSTEFDSIFVFTDQSATNLLLNDQVTSPFTTNLEDGTYYWRVQSYDQAGNQSNSSSTFSFTVNQ